MRRFITISALSACLAVSAGAADLLPLANGNYWVYRDQFSGESFTIRAGQPVAMQSGKIYHYLDGYTEQRVLVRTGEGGNLLVLDEESGQESILTGFGEGSGRWWPAPGRACVHQGQTQDRRETHDGAAGRWERVLAVKYQSSGCADTGILSEQFTENIGMLQRTVSTIAGPRTLELVYARIGTQVVETAHRGRFSVAAEQAIGLDVIRVTMRLDAGSAGSVRLRFASGQEFDVVLRNAEGKAVWRWSDGRVFDQALHEKSFSNLWTETVTIPRPQGVLTDYTVEGWLTTAEGEPKFSAMTKVPPPQIAPAEAGQ